MHIATRAALAVFILALAIPASAPPAAADSGSGLLVEWGTRDGEGGRVVAGLVTNHTGSRQANIQVTATWHIGSDVVASETTTAFISIVERHSTTPFKLVEPQDVEGATLSISATGTPTQAGSAGPLGVAPGVLNDDTYIGQVSNDGDVLAEDVVVYGVRRLGGIIVDAAGSVPIAMLASGQTAGYVIVFDDFSGEAVGSLTAESKSGTFRHTSWDNWFRDLGTSSFVDEVAWLADAGITFGCDVQQFCPKFPVTREQMAVFLDRALDLPTASEPAPFTDIATRPGYVRQAVANVYEAGITAGCSATQYCPLESVTRGQMSKFIVIGYGLTPIPGAGSFTDDDGHFSEQYNNRMAQDDITNGCAAGRYCPHSPVLREQMARFIFQAER